MSERPILFSGAMVRAILEGRKTQTRRVVKPQPPHSCRYAINGAKTHALCFGPPCEGHPLGMCVPPTPTSADHRLSCPYGAPGDTLWVRETWTFEGTDMMRLGRTRATQEGVVSYAADGARLTHVRPWQQIELWMEREHGQRPSIHMPRWASRLTLRVTDVRVQRLQEISEEDALAEGCGYSGPAPDKPMSERDLFAALWDSINAKRAPWASDPWVWAITFEKFKEAAHA